MAGTGGARPGAGRRTKAEILGLAKTLKECISDKEEKEMWKVVLKEAMKGSIQHAQLYFNYKYGKPSEHIIQEHDGETLIRIIRNGANHSTENPAPQPAAGTSEAETV